MCMICFKFFKRNDYLKQHVQNAHHLVKYSTEYNLAIGSTSFTNTTNPATTDTTNTATTNNTINTTATITVDSTPVTNSTVIMASAENMADPSNDVDVSIVEGVPALNDKQQGQRLRCINRRCKHGDQLTPALKPACNYYQVKHKPGREICKFCLQKYVNHNINIEKKFVNGQCILESFFPIYDKHVVIESSDEESEKPNISKSDLSLDIGCLENISKIATEVFIENKSDLLDQQIKLCSDYTEKTIVKALTDALAIDKIHDEVDKDVAKLKHLIYDRFKPVLCSSGVVDADDVMDKVIMNNGIAIGKNDIFKKRKSSIENKKEKKKKEDKLIGIDITSECELPSDLPPDGPVQYPNLVIGELVYAGRELLEPWKKGKVSSVINEDYFTIMFDFDEKLLTKKEIASFSLSPVRFQVGSRVIAKYNVPGESTENFYIGVVGEPPKLLNNFRYMIFYDNGNVQYRNHKDIRLILHKTNQVWNDVYPNIKDFLKTYLEIYPERQMVKLTKNQTVRVEHRNVFRSAKVLDVDCSIVKVSFSHMKLTECLYRGSSRLWNIYEKKLKSEKGIRLRQSGLAYLNKPFVEYSKVEEESPSTVVKGGVARKSTTKSSIPCGSGIAKCDKYSITNSQLDILKLPNYVPKPRKFVVHECTHSCIAWTKYRFGKTKNIIWLSIPLHFGFVRGLAHFNSSQKIVIYKTPCGRSIRSMKEMRDYLFITESEMTIDQFDFNSWVRPTAEFKSIKHLRFANDVSFGREFRAISCVNEITPRFPPAMKYMTARRPMPGVHINVDSNFLCGCDCTDNCQDKSKCSCWQMTIEGQQILPKNCKDPDIGYNYRRLPERVLTGIYECNKTCKCNSRCLNRVVQQPLSQNLQLFLTEKKGWGVRCLNDIPQGSFICTYVGYLLTESDANEGGKNYGDEYLAELDYIEVVEKIKEDYESDVSNDSDQESDQQALSSESESLDCRSSCGSGNMATDITLRLRTRNKPVDKTKISDKISNIISKPNARKIPKKPEPSKSIREYFGNNESVYIMDAKTSGNIGRYLNHSCCPNTFVQNVFVDTHDLRFPWISFFAHHYIQAGTELTWDYRYDVGSVPGKVMKCQCDSNYCRGRLL